MIGHIRYQMPGLRQVKPWLLTIRRPEGRRSLTYQRLLLSDAQHPSRLSLGSQWRPRCRHTRAAAPGGCGPRAAPKSYSDFLRSFSSVPTTCTSFTRMVADVDCSIQDVCLYDCQMQAGRHAPARVDPFNSHPPVPDTRTRR